MAEACLATGRHYLDISGEIPGFEALAKLDQVSRRAGVMLLPGVGFDVVPTDCLAAHLKNRMPDATHLRLYLCGTGTRPSRGTARSAIENLHRGGMIRQNGQLVPVPPAWQVRQVDFGRGAVKAVSIGWGDVATAYHSTGIPNIETYFAFAPAAIHFMRLMREASALIYSRPARALLKLALPLMRNGPTREQRRNGFSLILGEVSNQAGGSLTSKLKTPEGYTLTALASVEIMQRILAGDFKLGFQTPSRVFGPDFILQFYRVERQDLS
jgi:short subunit dehydrogenase-like uncharacterized protein